MTTQATTFTFSATVNIMPKPAADNYRMAAEIDELQNKFNLILFNASERAELLPISDKFYDLFTAFEQGREDACEMGAELLEMLKASPVRDLGAVLEIIYNLSDLLGLMDEDDYEVDTTPLGGWL